MAPTTDQSPWQTAERTARHRPEPSPTRNVEGGEDEPLIIGRTLLHLVTVGMLTYQEAMIAAAVAPYQFDKPGRNRLDLAAVFYGTVRLSPTDRRRMEKAVNRMIARETLVVTDELGSLAVSREILRYAVANPNAPFSIRTLLLDCLPPSKLLRPGS